MTVGAELALRATFVFTWAEVGASAVGRSLPTVNVATTELMRPWFRPFTVIWYVPAATESGAVTLSRADFAVQPNALEERRAAIDRDRNGRSPTGLGHDADGRGAQREGPEHAQLRHVEHLLVVRVRVGGRLPVEVAEVLQRFP